METINVLSNLLSQLKILLVALAAATSTNPVMPPKLNTPYLIRSYVESQALEYGINPKMAACIVGHESQWQDRDGDDGNSRGYWQISRIWHPEVSDATAYSLASSTAWSLQRIAEGHIKEWETYNLYCHDIRIFTDE